MLLESFASCDLAGDLGSLHGRSSKGCSKRRRSAICTETLGTRRSSSRESTRHWTHVPRAVATSKRCPEPEPEPRGLHSQDPDRTRFLLKFAQEATPELIELFEEHAPPHVADAMRTTIGRMLGTLPESFFDVTVAANKTEHLAQLCSSTVMTGYLFRNVQQRLDLQQQMGELDGRAALAGEVMSVCRSEQQYAEGSQKDGVQGHVMRWRHDAGLQNIPAAEYISSLERQVATLRQQVARDLYLHARGNPILNYLQVQEGSHLASLNNTARQDTYEAVNSVVHSVVAASDSEQGAHAHAVRVGELASLLYWLMIVGYHLRTLEVRWDIEQSLMLPS